MQRVASFLALPGDEYFFNGSSVLALHGIDRDRPMGDIDIFVTTALWFDMFDDYAIKLTDQAISRRMPGTLAEGEWALIVPSRTDSRRRIDPPILRANLFGITTDVFLNWRRRNGPGDFDPAFYLANTERIQGLPCAPLQFIMDWKLGQGRSKDLLDIVAIRNYLGIDGNIED